MNSNSGLELPKSKITSVINSMAEAIVGLLIGSVFTLSWTLIFPIIMLGYAVYATSHWIQWRRLSLEMFKDYTKIKSDLKSRESKINELTKAIDKLENKNTTIQTDNDILRLHQTNTELSESVSTNTSHNQVGFVQQT